MADQQFCLRWNNHQSTLISVFDSLLERGAMVDCTLAAEGQCLQAHKVVLSACSPYLETLLSQHYDKHPILLLKDVKFYELQAMMDYMYRGEVNVAQDKLGMFLKAAESLQIKGLSDSGGNEPPDTGGGTSAKRTSKGAPVTNVPRSGGGLTVERRRPQQPQTSQVVDIPSDSGSRDGSESPSLRRKRRRRTSGGDDSAVEGDSSNTGDVSRTQSSAPLSSDQVPMNGSADSNALGILSSLMDGSVETDNSVQEPGPSLGATSQTQPSQRIREKMEPTSAEMIQPKAEYLESEENVEDLTLDDDDTGMDAGPSQRQGSGYQWHMGDQSADEVFMAAQEAVGANRDAQESLAETRTGLEGLLGLGARPLQVEASDKTWIRSFGPLGSGGAAGAVRALGPILGPDGRPLTQMAGLAMHLQVPTSSSSTWNSPGAYPCPRCGKVYRWRGGSLDLLHKTFGGGISERVVTWPRAPLQGNRGRVGTNEQPATCPKCFRVYRRRKHMTGRDGTMTSFRTLFLRPPLILWNVTDVHAVKRIIADVTTCCTTCEWNVGSRLNSSARIAATPPSRKATFAPTCGDTILTC
ncbi:longitudinals lacking protein, isoforms H/M/V isoform X3 [Frankliniella occidentalis]|uniref:Longitudinals lacking protein, isoforms H/M/V isoform X3 n=1 Tax=Frankliniella occidentalis TaxID=133901 RepID=A0A9C6U7I2_FRAOC|nr:longitudinals lacking protein, isoforms H/M/V isoform X3 [Frankliniella occidentalis]